MMEEELWRGNMGGLGGADGGELLRVRNLDVVQVTEEVS